MAVRSCTDPMGICQKGRWPLSAPPCEISGAAPKDCVTLASGPAPNGRYKRAEFYAIARIAYGWFVSLQRNRKRFMKTFADRAYGGSQAALDHARQWRDQIVRDHPPKLRRELAIRPKGGSGPIPGVTCELNNQGRIRLWRAKTYIAPGNILQKTFGVARYGDEALPMAIKERQQQLKMLEGRSWVHPSEQAVRGASPRLEPLPPVPRPVPANQVVISTNSSGYPGVVRRGRYWTAQTTAGGMWKSQSFRVDLYGEQVALILAIWARLDQLQCET